MDVVYTRCCGLDIHKKTVVACLILSTEGAEPIKELRTFRTMTADLLALADWLQEAGCTHVAHGKHRGLLAPGLQPARRSVRTPRGQCATHQSGAGTENGCERCRLDRRAAAPWPIAREFYPLQTAMAGAGADPVSQYARPGARSDAQSVASRLGGREPEARVRCNGYLWRLSAGHIGGDPGRRTRCRDLGRLGPWPSPGQARPAQRSLSGACDGAP